MVVVDHLQLYYNIILKGGITNMAVSSYIKKSSLSTILATPGVSASSSNKLAIKDKKAEKAAKSKKKTTKKSNSKKTKTTKKTTTKK